MLLCHDGRRRVKRSSVGVHCKAQHLQANNAQKGGCPFLTKKDGRESRSAIESKANLPHRPFLFSAIGQDDALLANRLDAQTLQNRGRYEVIQSTGIYQKLNLSLALWRPRVCNHAFYIG